MPKRKASDGERAILSKKGKKLKTSPRSSTETAIARLKDLLADADALNESWRMRVMRLVQEKAEIESKNEELEKLVQSLRSSTKFGNRQKLEEKETAYIVHSRWEDPCNEELYRECEGIYHDLGTANKAALIAYKKIPNVDWWEAPITDFGTTTNLDYYDIEAGHAGRATDCIGAHQYKIVFAGTCARVVVEPCNVRSPATINRSKDQASDLPWKPFKPFTPFLPFPKTMMKIRDMGNEGSDVSLQDL